MQLIEFNVLCLPGIHVGHRSIELPRSPGESLMVEGIQLVRNLPVAEIRTHDVPRLQPALHAHEPRILTVLLKISDAPALLLRQVGTSMDGTGRNADDPIECNIFLQKDVQNPGRINAANPTAFED